MRYACLLFFVLLQLQWVRLPHKVSLPKNLHAISRSTQDEYTNEHDKYTTRTHALSACQEKLYVRALQKTTIFSKYSLVRDNLLAGKPSAKQSANTHLSKTITIVIIDLTIVKPIMTGFLRYMHY